MKLRIVAVLSAFLVAVSAVSVCAHEFWIEPLRFQAPSDGDVVADLRAGQNFVGPSLAWYDVRIARAEAILRGETRPLTGRAGDRPALSYQPQGTGLLTLLYQSAPSKLTYDKWQTFETFVTSKGFDWAPERHRARGLPEKGFRETYTRFCKALIGLGDGAGADAPRGMEAELIALDNPYGPDVSDGLRVAVQYRGAARAGAQLDVFEKTPGGLATSYHLTADAAGVAVVPVKPGHIYLLSSVLLREGEGEFPWQSLWASLTFFVP